MFRQYRKTLLAGTLALTFGLTGWKFRLPQVSTRPTCGENWGL